MRWPQRLGELLLRLLGLLMLAAALGFAATKAPDRPLESLIARWAPPPSDFLDLDGQLVHLRDEGPADDPLPIVLIHGTAASLHTWEGWAAELRKTRRVITFDLPGFGLTGPFAGPFPADDYRDEAYLAFLGRLFDRLHLHKMVLGGNSLGGQLAWEYAVAAPGRVAGLILVDAGGYASTPQSMPLGLRLARIPVLRNLGKHVLPHSLVEKIVRSVYGDPSRVTDERVDRYFELTLREGNRAALLRRFQQLEPGRYAAQIKTITQPTLILWGGRDRLIPPENGQAFARDIAGSRLLSFPALGHVPQEEDPAATLPPVQAFLHSLKP
ncbi:MAG: alpha/beta hydrolase [Burkholderiaceae bacterium]